MNVVLYATGLQTGKQWWWFPLLLAGLSFNLPRSFLRAGSSTSQLPEANDICTLS